MNADKSSLKLSEVKKRIFSHYRNNNSYNTYRSYKSTFENLIRLVGDKELDMITKVDFEDFKIKRSKEVSSISVNIDIRNIKAIFNKLVDFELLQQSKALTIKQFKIEKKKMLSIDPVDIRNILDNAEDPQLKQIIKFTLLTANRISEVLNTKIKDIDFEKSLINIYQQKSNCFKTIPISKQMLELLSEVLGSGDGNNIHKFRESESYLCIGSPETGIFKILWCKFILHIWFQFCCFLLVLIYLLLLLIYLLFYPSENLPELNNIMNCEVFWYYKNQYTLICFLASSKLMNEDFDKHSSPAVL